MHKIALVYCPFVAELSLPPLGISCLSAYISKYGYDQVDLFDYNHELLTNIFERDMERKLKSIISFLKKEINFYSLNILEEYNFYMLRNIQYLKSIFLENSHYSDNDIVNEFILSRIRKLIMYDVVGFSVMFEEQIKLSAKMAMLLKKHKPSIKIVIGGTAANSQDFLGCYDQAIYGDGEIKFLEYLNDLTIVENNGECVVDNSDNLGVGFIKKFDLDTFPAPDFSKLFAKYQYLSPYNVIPYAITRGCYWSKCLFCSYGWADSKSNKATAEYRKLGVEKILDDILYLREKYKTKHFYFTVDVTDPTLLRELSRNLIDKSIEIFWRTEIRAEKTFINKDILSDMYKSGCRAISFGFESVTQNVINVMKKGINVENSIALIDILYNLDIGINTDFFIGFPSETPEQAAMTHQFLIDNSHKIFPHRTGHFFHFYRNSPIEKLVKESRFEWLFYNENDEPIKLGMSFEGQKRQLQIGLSNMFFNSNTLRFPCRNDGVIFFLYCSRFSLKEIAYAIKSNKSVFGFFQQIIESFRITSFYIDKLKLKIDYEKIFTSLNEKLEIKDYFSGEKNKRILLKHYCLLKEFIKFLSLPIPEKNFLFECSKIDFYLLFTAINSTNLVPFINEQAVNVKKLDIDEIKKVLIKNPYKIYIRKFNYNIHKIINMVGFSEIEKNGVYGIFDINGVHITHSKIVIKLIKEIIKYGEEFSIDKFSKSYSKPDSYEGIFYLIREKIISVV